MNVSCTSCMRVKQRKKTITATANLNLLQSFIVSHTSCFASQETATINPDTCSFSLQQQVNQMHSYQLTGLWRKKKNCKQQNSVNKKPFPSKNRTSQLHDRQKNKCDDFLQTKLNYIFFFFLFSQTQNIFLTMKIEEPTEKKPQNSSLEHVFTFTALFP